MKVQVTKSTKRYTNVVTAFLTVALLTVYSRAQDDHRFTLQGGAGFSPLVGAVSKRLDNGWHVTFGGGYNLTNRLSATLDYAYNGYGVSEGVLNEAHAPGGNSHMWSLTVNPRLRLMPDSKLDPYVIGGVGYYRRTVQFTQPSVVPVLIFDPFFGNFFNTFVQANQVIGEITQGGIGGSAGGGFDISVGSSGVKLFTEARYHYANTGRIVTRMIPLTVGIRW